MWSFITVTSFWPCCWRCIGSEAPSPARRLPADLLPYLFYRDLFVVAVSWVWALGNSLTVDTGSVSAELKLSP